MFESRIHAFVKYDSAIAWLQQERQHLSFAGLLGKLPHKLMGGANYDESWVPQLSNVKVISLETVQRELAAGDQCFARFEEYPAAAMHSLL